MGGGSVVGRRVVVSLINDMLRDLESRKQEDAGEREFPVRIVAADEIHPVGPPRMAYFAGGILMLAVLGSLAWVYWGQFRKPYYPPATQALAVNPMKPEPTSNPPAEVAAQTSPPTVPAFPVVPMAPPQPAPSPAPEIATQAPRGEAAASARVPADLPPAAEPGKPRPSARPAKPGLPAPMTAPRRAMPMAEDSPSGLYQRGMQYFDAGKLSQARDVLERVLVLDSGVGAARLLLARVAARQGDVSGALQALGPQPTPGESSDWLRLRAQLLLKQGSLGQAETALDQLGGGDSADPELAGLRGALRQRQGRHGEAVESYRRAIALQPGQSRWWLGLAISLEASERFEEALQAYQSVAELGADSPEVRAYVVGRMAVLRAGR
jgi:MSHA biogenesis protein MshN